MNQLKKFILPDLINATVFCLFVIIVTARSSVLVAAVHSEHLVVSDLLDVQICQPSDGRRTSSLDLAALDWQCRDKSHLLRLFKGYQVVLGTMTAVCAFPGPAQAALPLFAGSEAAMSVVYFYIAGLPCEENDPDFSPDQIEQIERRICVMMGKKYYRGLGPTDRSRCL